MLKITNSITFINSTLEENMAPYELEIASFVLYLLSSIIGCYLMFNRGFASESKNPGRMIVMDFITNVFKHFDLDVKKGPTPYLGLTQPLRAVLGTPLILLLEQ